MYLYLNYVYNKQFCFGSLCVLHKASVVQEGDIWTPYSRWKTICTLVPQNSSYLDPMHLLILFEFLHFNKLLNSWSTFFSFSFSIFLMDKLKCMHNKHVHYIFITVNDGFAKLYMYRSRKLLQSTNFLNY